MPTSGPRRWIACIACCAALLLGMSTAWAQADPPGRVARLSYQDASVEWAPAGSNTWTAADPNWPMTTGDRIRIPAGSRTELYTGSTAVRLQGPSQLEISLLDDTTTRLTLNEGSVNVLVRSLQPNERVEVDTGNLAMVAQQPGEFRVDADPAGDSTRVTVRSGSAIVYGENGESQQIASPREARYAGRRLTPLTSQTYGPRDGFDQWVAERSHAEEQSSSARYLSRDTIGYQELDANGDWQNDPTYGAIWWPRVTVADWAPYRYGQWRWIAPWGWTWVDDARWGFAPFHYGRWVHTGARWGWVPGPASTRPVYAPALVGFEGGRPGGPRDGAGRPPPPGNTWFPLGPGEAWHPPYGASQRYLDQINRGAVRPGAGQPPRFAYQRRPEAVTSMPEADFGNRRPRPPADRGRDDANRPGPMPGRPFDRRPDVANDVPRELRPDEPIRSTRRERPPPVEQQQPNLPPRTALPQDGPARSQAEQERRAQAQREQIAERERFQRDQQQQRMQTQQDQARRENQAQQDRIRNEQAQREQFQHEQAARNQRAIAQEQQQQQQRQVQQQQAAQQQAQRAQQQAMQEQMHQRQQQQQQQQPPQQQPQQQYRPPRTAIPDRPGPQDGGQRQEGRGRN